MTLVPIGPQSWVRCIRSAPTFKPEIVAGAIYKVTAIHAMRDRCNGPPEHQCQKVAFMLEGVKNPSCSSCFVPIRPGGPQFLAELLGIKVKR